MRRNRKRHSELDPITRMKANARSYANTYLRRGKISKEPCFICKSEDSQMHHSDYGKPLDITWVCRECHLSIHAG